MTALSVDLGHVMIVHDPAIQDSLNTVWNVTKTTAILESIVRKWKIDEVSISIIFYYRYLPLILLVFLVIQTIFLLISLQ